jgi:hypothetical protein
VLSLSREGEVSEAFDRAHETVWAEQSTARGIYTTWNGKKVGRENGAKTIEPL